jgi:hypothetical protein
VRRPRRKGEAVSHFEGGEGRGGNALKAPAPRGFEALHLHHGSSAVLADVTYPKSTTAVNTAQTGPSCHQNRPQLPALPRCAPSALGCSRATTAARFRPPSWPSSAKSTNIVGPSIAVGCVRERARPTQHVRRSYHAVVVARRPERHPAEAVRRLRLRRRCRRIEPRAASRFSSLRELQMPSRLAQRRNISIPFRRDRQLRPPERAGRHSSQSICAERG